MGTFDGKEQKAYTSNNMTSMFRIKKLWFLGFDQVSEVTYTGVPQIIFKSCVK